MSRLFFGPNGSSLSKPEDVIKFLGKQEQHWKKDRSAYQTAHSWFAAQDLPASIRAILKTDSTFAEATLRKAVFENKTRLDDYGRESQTDVLAILGLGADHAVLGVEAKVDESFGPRVREWNDYSPSKLRRLAGLLDRLNLRQVAIGDLRYQLLHRTVATIIEAERLGARHAAMIVQSFDRHRTGFEDFVAFADAFGMPLTEPGILSQSKTAGGVAIRLGWTENPMQLFDS
jgi:hypothetical protein